MTRKSEREELKEKEKEKAWVARVGADIRNFR